MKQNKRISLFLVGCLLLTGTVFALEAGDTLISQNYLLSTLLAPIEKQVNDTVKKYMNDGYENQVEYLDEAKAELNYQLSGGESGSESKTVKLIEYGQGDTITLKVGATLVAGAGRILLTHNGVVVDATTGGTVPSGSYTTAGHRYIVAEDTELKAEVLSGLATMGYSGVYIYRAGSGKNHPFHDVFSTDYYNEAVRYVYDNGLLVGDGYSFNPSQSMNRGMAVTILYQLAGEPTDQMDAALSVPNPFYDAADDAWFTKFVRWAANEGVSYGSGTGEFMPTRELTMTEMIQFLMSFGETKLGLTLEGSADISKLEDGDQVPDWANRAVQWAASNGIWTGSFAFEPASRADIAVLLMNFTKIYGNP